MSVRQTLQHTTINIQPYQAIGGVLFPVVYLTESPGAPVQVSESDPDLPYFDMHPTYLLAGNVEDYVTNEPWLPA